MGVTEQERAAAPSSIESTRSWRVALAAMWCLAFGPSTILVTGFGVFIGPIARSEGWSPGQVALAISFTALMVMIVTPVQGVLTDRLGPRRVVLASIPLFVAGLAAMALAPKSLTAFYMMWAALPVLALGLWPTSYLKAVGGWFDRRLGFALGLANAGFGAGALLMPLIGGGLIALYGWRMAFVGLAGLAALTFPVAFVFLKESPFAKVHAPPADARAGKGAQGGASGIAAFLRDPLFLKLMVGYALIGFAGTGFAANLVPMSIHEGASPGRAVALQALYGAVALVARLVTGRLLDSVFAGKVMAVIVFLAFIACAAFIWPGAPVAVTALAVACHGLLLGGEFSVLAYIVRRNYRTGAFGKVYGVVFALFQAGAAIGAAFIALSAARTGGYTLGMTGYALALGLSLIAFLKLEPYRLSPFDHR